MIAVGVIIVIACLGLAWACCAMSGEISEEEKQISDDPRQDQIIEIIRRESRGDEELSKMIDNIRN